MAGAGYKQWVDGDILTAGDVNTYLMDQAVMVFADSSARTTALPTPSEGMVSYLADSNVVEIYTGAAWVSLDDPNAIQNSIVDAKGDIITATADNTPARLAVGTNGYVLTADSAESTGLKWASVASGSLIKTATASPSAVTSVSIDSAFSATYKNYLIQIELAGSTAETLQMRFRASGSDDSNTNYNWQTATFDNTSGTFTRDSSKNFGRAGTVYNGVRSSWTMFLFNPQAAIATTWAVHGYAGSAYTSPLGQMFTGNFSAATQFTGITIFATANITGTIKIYGIED